MAATMMSSTNIARPSTGVPSMRRNARAIRSASRMVVRADAEHDNKVDSPNTPLVGPKDGMSNDSPAAELRDAPNPKPAVAQATEAMAFDGPGPELINGRLAMLGFVAALGAELATGQTVVQQFKGQPLAVVLTFALFWTASLIPIFKGKGGKVENPPFTKKAEMYNGRAAMIGFAALLLTERYLGGSVF